MAKQYYALMTAKADGHFQYGGWQSQCQVSDNYNAISALRDNMLKAENHGSLDPANVYVIHTVTMDEMRAAMTDQKLDGNFHFPVTMPTTGMVSHGHDAIMGRDYMHRASDWLSGPNLVTQVNTLTQMRNETLDLMRAAEANTNPYKMPDLSHPDIQRAMQMVYQGGNPEPALQSAIDAMGKNGFDTAAQAPEFVEKFRELRDELSAQHPEWGPNQLQTEAARATALDFQMNECGNDLRQQSLYANIAGFYGQQREHSAMLDAHVRDEAFSHASEAVTQHLTQNGQYLSNAQAQSFRHDVMMRVGEEANKLGFDQHADVQKVIAEVAKNHEAQARAAGDDKAGFNFANIADTAESRAEDIPEHSENDGLDEIGDD